MPSHDATDNTSLTPQSVTSAFVESYNAGQQLKPMSTETGVTQLLLAWKAGDEGARDNLVPILYEELRRIAARYLQNERAAHTLQPTALVHEAYLRLVQHQLPDWESRAHFVGVAAYLMRQLLLENARRNNTQKRGQGRNNVPLTEALSFPRSPAASFLTSMPRFRNWPGSMKGRVRSSSSGSSEG